MHLPMGGAIRHGGYATSTDLLHWKDEGSHYSPESFSQKSRSLTYISGKHCFFRPVRCCFRGKMSKRNLLVLEKEAIIRNYTGTGVGTCLHGVCKRQNLVQITRTLQ